MISSFKNNITVIEYYTSKASITKNMYVLYRLNQDYNNQCILWLDTVNENRIKQFMISLKEHSCFFLICEVKSGSMQLINNKKALSDKNYLRDQITIAMTQFTPYIANNFFAYICLIIIVSTHIIIIWRIFVEAWISRYI